MEGLFYIAGMIGGALIIAIGQVVCVVSYRLYLAKRQPGKFGLSDLAFAGAYVLVLIGGLSLWSSVYLMVKWVSK